MALPVFAFSETVQDGLDFEPPCFAGNGLAGPALGTVIFIYGGWTFLTGALGEIRARRPGMLLLIGIAIVVAFAASIATELGASISTSGGNSLV